MPFKFGSYARMIKLYNSGLSAKQVANRMGLRHSNSVRQVLKKIGILRTQSEAATLAVSKGRKQKSIKALIKSAKTDNRFNPAKAHHGNQHPNWIEDRSLVKQKRSMTEEKKFFKQLIQQANFKCQLTGEGGTLSVHHIKGVWSNPELMFEKGNCTVVLKTIHLKFHKMYGNRTTEIDWKEFLSNNEFMDCIKEHKKRNFVPFEDKTGMRFGRLVVLFKEGKTWRCRCDCGNETNTYASCLNAGKTKSCGCLMREINKSSIKRRKIWLLSPVSKKGNKTK